MTMRIYILLLLAGMATSFYGYGCTYTVVGAPYAVNYGNIIVQRDVPVGQAISNEIVGQLALAYSCTATADEGTTAGISSAILSYAFTSASGRRVYNTRLPGVGISFGFTEDTTAGSAHYSGTSYLTAGNILTFSWSSSAGYIYAYRFQPVIQLWKTGDITSGALSGQLASFVAWTAQFRGGSPAPEIPINAGSGSVVQVACSVTTPSLVFPIGEIPASYFGTTIGATPGAAQNTQNLGLNCDSGANISVMLSGIQNPDVSDSSVLALSGQGSAGVASGIGVQLIYNGAPLSLNSTLLLKQSTGGQETFPVTARYYQTKTAVGTGTANASATLNIIYQ